MKVLFLTVLQEDYLADSIFHGFRKLFAEDCIDYPKCERLYNNCPEEIKRTIRGNGFSLYSGLLEDIKVDRDEVEQKIKVNFFDLIVFGNIQRQFLLFKKYRKFLNKYNTIILDGEDSEKPYPAKGYWWKRPQYWFLPKAHEQFLYFKREWTVETQFSFWIRILPRKLKQKISQHKNLRKISFAFPEEKIIKYKPGKEKVFPTHIVDEEVSSHVQNAKVKYAFDSEKAYYEDIAHSEYGVTTKRAGWDCLRHYEIAANGTVMVFKKLTEKPSTCAPHDLIIDENVIDYSDYADLMFKINNISIEKYNKLQEASLDWIKSKTTTNIVEYILNEMKVKSI